MDAVSFGHTGVADRAGMDLIAFCAGQITAEEVLRELKEGVLPLWKPPQQ